MSNNTTENIFQSIDYIIEARMSEIAKDITELCTIVKVYEEKDNKPNTYYVSNGQLKFDAIAQSDDVKYLKDAQVYVLIPNGDYSGNKLILGSYKSEDPYKYKYITPEDEILKAYDLGTSILENGILYNSLTIPRVGFEDEFTHMLFTFNLSTYGFDNYAGQYTLEFVFADHAVNADGDYIDTAGNVLKDQTTAKTYGLSIPHTELYGNPYEYDPNYPISYIIPIYKIIEKDPDFHLYNIKSIKYAINQADNTGTIVLHNCQISLGYAAKDFANETTQIRLALDSPITTPNTVMEKDSAFEYSANVSKDMSFDLGIAENNILTIYNEQNTYSKAYTAYWCRYVKDHQKTPENMDIEESGTHWMTIGYNSLDISNAFQFYDFEPNSEWDEDRIKVIVRYEGILKEGEQRPYWESNILVFRNLANAPSQGANNANINPDILLQLADNDDGNYNIYGTDHRLVSYAKKNQNTTVTVASFFDGSPVDNSYIFTWKIPYSNSMIKPPKLDTDWEPDDKDNPKFWIKTNTALSTIQYDFSETYYSNRVHNIIYCEIQKIEGGKAYYGSIHLAFGLTNTNGSNYALNIVPEHYGGLALSIPKENKYYSIKYKAILEDAQGQLIDAQNYQDKLEWSWYYPDSYSGNTDLMARGGFTLIVDNSTQECEIKRAEADAEGNALKWEYVTYARARAILKVTLKNWQNENGLSFDLEAYYPIGMINLNQSYLNADKVKNYYISGATRIMYQYDGTLGSYDQNPYQFYEHTPEQEKLIPTGQWHLIDETAVFNQNGEIVEGKEQIAEEYPALKSTPAGCSLSPLPQIATTVKPLYLWMAQTGAKTGHWFQPILITQDTYASDLLNTWNGELSIDTEGNKILAQSIGAGVKNTDNTYTGVLMGKVLLNEGKSNETTNYGLYGFKNGELKFKFDENGGGYLAGIIKATEGQIAGWEITNPYITQNFAGFGGETSNDVRRSGSITFGLPRINSNDYYDDYSKLSTTPCLQIKYNNEPRFTLYGYGNIDTASWINSAGYFLQTPLSQVGLGPGVFGSYDFWTTSDNQIKYSQNYFTWGSTDASWQYTNGSIISYSADISNIGILDSSSDINVKHSITPLEEKYNNFFDSLAPCAYKYNYGTSDRFHTGFIAQEVVQALSLHGLTTQDFAAVVQLKMPNAKGAEWLLRREEFIALNTWQIQKLKSRITELEALLREKGVI